MQDEISKKVTILIENGISTNDPLKEREEQISLILNLESTIETLKLGREQKEEMLILFKNKLNSIPETDMVMERLNRQGQILNEHYQLLKKTLESTKINNVIEKGDVQIVDLAKKPRSPYTPNHQRDIVMFCLFGIGIAFTIVFLIEFIDNTIKTIDEIEK